MTAAPTGPGRPDRELLGGWGIWVSATGRWWAVYGSVLTRHQSDAGCASLVYADDAEGSPARSANRRSCATSTPHEPGYSRPVETTGPG
jgi:hypothetical protein